VRPTTRLAPLSSLRRGDDVVVVVITVAVAVVDVVVVVGAMPSLLLPAAAVAAIALNSYTVSDTRRSINVGHRRMLQNVAEERRTEAVSGIPVFFFPFRRCRKYRYSRSANWNQITPVQDAQR
jgi:hypothetical protein